MIPAAAGSSHSSPSASNDMSVNESERFRQSRKRPAGELAALSCSICTESLKEPTIAFCCGRTYCQTCIKDTVESTGRCPQCDKPLTKQQLCPNFALSDLMARKSRAMAAPPTDAVNMVMEGHLDQLSPNDMDRLVAVLQRRRQILASDDLEYQRQMLHEFLQQLHKIKSAELEKLNREVNLINHDLAVVKSRGGSDLNTEPLRNVQLATHFHQLAQVYLESRPLGEGGGDPGALDQFARTLSHVTQYSTFKPLATLSYKSDRTAQNIVSSIAFDKDAEYLAISGVSKKIKLFEYLNVIETSTRVLCPSGELSCTASISCVAWNPYFKNRLCSSDYLGRVNLWDTGSLTSVQTLGEHEKRVWSVDWSQGDPRLVASGGDDGRVKLWSTDQPRPVTDINLKASVCSVKFGSESTHVIALGCGDHCVHYYDIRHTRQPLRMLFGHKKAVSYVQFCGRDQIASASIDGSLKLWNLNKDNSCVRSFIGHVNQKNFVGLCTDGEYLACGSENNSVYLYHTSLSKPLFSWKFDGYERSTNFVSAVAWKRGSPVVLAGNSQGVVKILQLI